MVELVADPSRVRVSLSLLGELARVQEENRKLRKRVRCLTASRNRWRAEARAWRWGAMQGHRR